MTPCCIRCGKEGNVYPVDYTEPRSNIVHRWNLCFSCAHEHHRMMKNWVFRYKEEHIMCDDCIHLIGRKCEYPSSTVDPMDCPYFEEASE